MTKVAVIFHNKYGMGWYSEYNFTTDILFDKILVDLILKKNEIIKGDFEYTGCDTNKEFIEIYNQIVRRRNEIHREYYIKYYTLACNDEDRLKIIINNLQFEYDENIRIEIEESSFYSRILGLDIQWLEKGDKFLIREYDGLERIELLSEMKFIEAQSI